MTRAGSTPASSANRVDAGVMELADITVLKTVEETRGGSSPLPRTNLEGFMRMLEKTNGVAM